MEFNKDELRLINVMFAEHKDFIYKSMRRKNCSYESSKFLRTEMQDTLDLEARFEEYSYKKYNEN